jgi:uncharacterized membrane protein
MNRLMEFFFKYRWSVFARGEFGFANRPSWWIVALLVIAIIGLAGYLYLRIRSRSGVLVNAGLMALRVCLLLLLLLMIMRPVIVIPSVIPRSSSLAVLIDDSRSMQLSDENGRRRIDAVREILNGSASLLTQVGQKFRLRLYGFSNGVASLPVIENGGTGSTLRAEGNATDLTGALAESVRDAVGSELAAIVLISDGGANTTREPGEQLRSLRAAGIPVYTIGVGNPERFRDLELTRVSLPRRVLIGSAITAEIYLRRSGDIGADSLTIKISEDGREIKKQSLDIRNVLSGGEARPVTIEFTPGSAGAHRYSFEIASVEGEMTAENNLVESMIEVTDESPRILYLEGEPRWEYGKLRFSLGKNEKKVTLVSVLRSADGKFYRQGVGSGSELTGGFPATTEELFGYQGLVLGSIEANFFSYEQLRLIEQFASQRGGGVLALGGGRAFGAGKYAGTPVADLLPVVLSAQPEMTGPESTSGFRPRLTERGRTHPVTRLNEDRGLSAKSWEEMPGITIPELLPQTKPGATTILEAVRDGGQNRAGSSLPLLVEQRYGRGRALALTTNDTWRWRMELPSQNTAHESFWRQLLRYLVSTTPGQFTVGAGRDAYAVGDEVLISAEVNDSKFEPITDAAVAATLTLPSGGRIELPLELAPLGMTSMPGTSGAATEEKISRYVGKLIVTEPGSYQVGMSARRGGKILGEASAAFLVSERSREYFNAVQNVGLLKRIAAETGGRYFPIGKSGEILDELTMLGGRNSERVSRDLWDMPVNFLLLIGLAGAEWFLRKRQGLA